MPSILPASPISRLSPSDLALRIDTPDAPLVLDVRREAGFAMSAYIIAGALRCLPEDVAAFASAGPPREAVVYCVYGHNVSEEAALTLQAAGWTAHQLAGGIEGGEDGVDAPEDIAAWRAAVAPLRRVRTVPDAGNKAAT
ncbi:MAG: hypothetical protein H7332_19870 [Bdellovibrionales bacterium]|nr:hypothetical protein [Ramlibacter sp.]